MHAGKALVLVVLGALVLATGVFSFVPSTRPPIVKKWFRQATGFTPAKTPTEALDKFKDAIRKRDYETAAEYCTRDYREQMLKVHAQAKKLGNAIDSLAYNMDKNGVVNPKTKAMLKFLEPFPRSFKVVDVKEKGNAAVAVLDDDEAAVRLDNPIAGDFFTKHALMIGSLVPAVPLREVALAKDEVGHWRIDVPVTSRLRLAVDHLKDNATNYANAIYQVRDEVKNNPVTKEQVQSELERRLNESK